MNEPLERSRGSDFGLGLLMGACVGAGLVLWLAPRMAAIVWRPLGPTGPNSSVATRI